VDNLQVRLRFSTFVQGIFLKHLVDRIFPKLVEAGVSAPQSLFTFQIELQTKADRVRESIGKAKRKISKHLDVSDTVEIACRHFFSYRRTLLMLCKVALEDWVFLFRKHLLPAQLGLEEVLLYQKTMSESSIKDANKLTGLLLSPLLELPRREASAKLQRAGISGIVRRFVIFWILRVHSNSFERQLAGITTRTRARPAWRTSAD